VACNSTLAPLSVDGIVLHAPNRSTSIKDSQRENIPAIPNDSLKFV
jgi:hypothetical protein